LTVFLGDVSGAMWAVIIGLVFLVKWVTWLARLSAFRAMNLSNSLGSRLGNSLA